MMRVVGRAKSYRHVPVLDHSECSIRRFTGRPRQRRNAQESVACIFSGIQIRLLLHPDHFSLLIDGLRITRTGKPPAIRASSKRTRLVWGVGVNAVLLSRAQNLAIIPN